MEIVRLAREMFNSMGMDLSERGWEAEGLGHVRDRLGDDLAVFVVDHPAAPGRLVASAAGTIARRLPGPLNPSGRAGYVQWVFTDPEYRGRGLGSAVMSALIGWYDDRGVRTLELHATESGEPVYRALGFTDEGPLALRRRSR
jgi:GNAT superfamily N-acetyltransferase